MKLHSAIIAAALCLAPVVLTTACSDDASEHQATGSLEITGKIASALNANDVDVIVVSLSKVDAPFFSENIQLTNQGGTWTGFAAQIPAGTYTVLGYASHNGLPRYHARADLVSVQPGQVASLSLSFHSDVAPDPFQNSAPYITAISTASRTVEPGTPVVLSATATDADNDPLTYTWSQDGTPLQSGQQIHWTAPNAPGDYHVTVSVSDGKGGASLGTITITVAAAPPQTGSLAISVQFFDAPQITSIQLRDLDAMNYNSQPLPGTSVNVEVNTIGGTICTPGDSLCSFISPGQLQLTSDCFPGLIIPWAPGPIPPPIPGHVTGTPGQACSIHVTIQDSAGATSTGTLLFHLGQPL